MHYSAICRSAAILIRDAYTPPRVSCGACRARRDRMYRRRSGWHDRRSRHGGGLRRREPGRATTGPRVVLRREHGDGFADRARRLARARPQAHGAAPHPRRARAGRLRGAGLVDAEVPPLVPEFRQQPDGDCVHWSITRCERDHGRQLERRARPGRRAHRPSRPVHRTGGIPGAAHAAARRAGSRPAGPRRPGARECGTALHATECIRTGGAPGRRRGGLHPRLRIGGARARLPLRDPAHLHRPERSGQRGIVRARRGARAGRGGRHGDHAGPADSLCAGNPRQRAAPCRGAPMGGGPPAAPPARAICAPPS